ncbi:MAG: DNA polymerase III subunit beta [Dehalococcoidales bacterium]|nr:DNA polymerase III subunit beta [Dehalococcoidales bacterium]
MQIRVDKLRANLALLQPVVPKKATLPLITHVLVQEGQMVATDLENTVSLNVPEARECLLLPFHAVMELLKYVPGDEMLTLEPNGKTIKLSWKGGSALYEVKEAQDYPPIPMPEFQAEGDLNGDLFIEALLAALPYCATESTRPVLTGVTVYLDNVLQIAGADGFRLSYQSLKQSYPMKQTLILPASTVKVLEHLWHKSPAMVPLESSLVRQLMAVRPVKLSLAEGIADFRFSNIRLITKLIAGTPPDHLALLNNFREPIKVKLIAPELRNAVRRLEGIARDGTGIVRLKWTESNMTVSARSEDKGEISAEIPVQPESLPGRVALNVKYLLEYLEGKEGVITLGKDEGSSPALFHYGSKPVAAIMPMNVQWEEDKPKNEEPEGETTEEVEENAGETEESVEENPEVESEEIESPIEGETPDEEGEEAPEEPQSEPVTAGVTAEATSAENPPEPESVKTPEKRRGRRKKK